MAAVTAGLLFSIFSLPSASVSAGRTATSVINTLLNGKGVPDASLGINGDFYIDKTGMNLYGPKASGKWPLPVSMRGSVGPMGPVGVDGKAGEKGVAATPTTGSKGETGAIGATGATGAVGAPGSSGSGASGPTGATGATGATGLAGATGASGINGVNGTAGAAGTNGTNGTNGVAGDRGLPGVAGVAGDAGAAGLAGTNGAQGLPGSQGSQGSQGVAGAVGATGPSEVNWGAVTFSTIMVAAPGYGTSSPFGNFKAGNSYMVDLYIYGESTQGNERSLEITFATSPTAQAIHSQYLVINGLSARNSMSLVRIESSILVKILINGLETTADFSITATIGSGSDTSDDAVTLRGNFTSQLVGRAITN